MKIEKIKTLFLMKFAMVYCLTVVVQSKELLLYEAHYDLPHGYFSSYQVMPIIKSCKAHLLRFPSSASREAVDHLLQHTWRC